MFSGNETFHRQDDRPRRKYSFEKMSSGTSLKQYTTIVKYYD
jgi:hypothetical protein